MIPEKYWTKKDEDSVSTVPVKRGVSMAKVAARSSAPSGIMTRGLTANLTPEAQTILNRLGVDSNSAINEAIMKYGERKGIIPSVIMTPNGIGNFELPNGREDDTMSRQQQQEPRETDSMDDIEKMMAKMMRMKMMKQMISEMSEPQRSASSNESGFPDINKMFQMNLAKSMMKEMSGSNDDKNGMESMFTRQMNDVKKEINDSKKWEQLVNSMKGDKDKFGYPEMIKMYADRDRDIEKARQDTEKARQDTLTTEFNGRMQRFEDMIASKPSSDEQYSDLAKQLQAIKAISSEIKGEVPAKSKSDTAKEFINAMSPMIRPLAEAAGNRISNPAPAQYQQAPVPHADAQVPPEDINPEELYSEARGYDVPQEDKEENRDSTAQVI